MPMVRAICLPPRGLLRRAGRCASASLRWPSAECVSKTAASSSMTQNSPWPRTDRPETLRNPLTPQGRAHFPGQGTFVARRLNATGHYTAQDIALPYVRFPAGGLSSAGDGRMDNHGAEVPDFHAQALGRV